MNVNAANEDMLSASELKKKKGKEKLPLGGEGEGMREQGQCGLRETDSNLEDSINLCGRVIFQIMFVLPNSNYDTLTPNKIEDIIFSITLILKQYTAVEHLAVFCGFNLQARLKQTQSAFCSSVSR